MFELAPQVDLLSRMMDASQMRHQAIAQNLANVNTAGYDRVDVEFEGQLKRALKAGGSVSVNDIEPIVTRESNLPRRADGSNVDVDYEIGELNRNALLYQTYLQVLTTQLSQMKAAMRGP